MANADYTFWLGREAEQPMRVWQDERGCIAESVAWRNLFKQVKRGRKA